MEMRKVAGEVQSLLVNLPGNVNPVNLEELRKVKTALVELETKADTVRKVLEDLMDDDDEKYELNLSSRPMRENRRRQRERERLKRELDRARGAQGQGKVNISSSIGGVARPDMASDPSPSLPGMGYTRTRPGAHRHSGGKKASDKVSHSKSSRHHTGPLEDKMRELRKGGGQEDINEAQDALEDMVEQEQEEEDIEQVEDVLEFYHQRASSTQSDAERMLEEARDLEESIRVTLSAARYEVNRLQLMLAIGSFSASVGAVTAGIFGMNMQSNLEGSVEGFWGLTFSIILGCLFIFEKIWNYTRAKNIF
eukprot:gene3434-13489_t